MATYTPIAHHELSSAVSSFTISGLSQSYAHLAVHFVARYASTSGAQYTKIQFNGNTNSVYASNWFEGTTSGISGGRETNTTSAYLVYAHSYSTNDVSSAYLHLNNYTLPGGNKQGLVRWATQTGVGMYGIQFRDPSPITSITFNSVASNFIAGTRVTIYGIEGGSPKAVGGDSIGTDGTYWYHAFTRNGSFKPTQNITGDILLIAGGGAGGGTLGTNFPGSGGGAGGVLLYSSQALNSFTSYPVTVGLGATGADGRSNQAWNPTGNATTSTFGSLTGPVIGGSGKSGGASAGPAYTNALGEGGSGAGNVAGNGFNGTSGQGNAGGAGVGTAPAYGAGGGGGAGTVGGSGSGSAGGNGGSGTNAYAAWAAATNTGVNGYFAGGGGGAALSGSAGTGGLGGGGNGGVGSSSAAGSPAVPNTGSGGGAGAGSSSGGDGASGIVIVRYPV